MLPQAEFFDVKVLSLGVTLLQNKQVIANYTPVHLVDLIRLELAVNMGLYDANSVCWGEKVCRASNCQLWRSCRANECGLAEHTNMSMPRPGSRVPPACVDSACLLKLLVNVSKGRAA